MHYASHEELILADIELSGVETGEYQSGYGSYLVGTGEQHRFVCPKAFNCL